MKGRDLVTARVQEGDYQGRAATAAATDRIVPPIIPWMIAAAVLAVYLGFLTRNYYWDGVVFASTIESANSLASLFHPNHLFYNVLGYGLFKLAAVFSKTIRPLEALQIGNCVLSALASAVFYLILKKILGSVYLASALTVVFAFSATWWRFSTDADAYIPAILMMLMAFWLVLPQNHPRVFLVSLVHICALLFHQLAVFFYPVIAFGLFYQDRGAPRRKRLWRVVRYTVTTAAVTLGIYGYCFYLAFKSLRPAPFLRWITYYTPENGFTLNPWKDFTWTLSGSIRLFFGGRFNLIRPLMSPAVVMLIAGLAVCAVLIVAGIVRRQREAAALLSTITGLFRAGDSPDPERTVVIRLCLLWVGAYVVFLFFFIPLNAFYRLFYLPPLIVLLGEAIAMARRPRQSRQPGLTALGAAAVVLCNFLFLIFPYSRVRPGTPLSLALSMNQVWDSKTEVYYSNKNTDDYLVSYFNPSTRWIALDTGHLDQFEDRLRDIQAQGGQAWLETTAIDQLKLSAEGRLWLSTHKSVTAEHKLTEHGYDIELVQIVPAAVIYRFPIQLK